MGTVMAGWGRRKGVKLRAKGLHCARLGSARLGDDEFAVNGILFRVRIAALEYSISGGSVGGINAACRVLYNRVLI